MMRRKGGNAHHSSPSCSFLVKLSKQVERCEGMRDDEEERRECSPLLS